MENMFRLLKAHEIECKISNTKNIATSGIQLLLYKTARTDMDILDETVKPMNWSCEYQEIKGNLYCGITIEDNGKKTTKWDCGVESAFGDKEKGEASDAFKRAGTKCGIGRELYTVPFIWIKFRDYKLSKDKTYDEFEVVSISYNENKQINGLQIKNKTLNKIVFDMKTPNIPVIKEDNKTKQNIITDEEYDKLCDEQSEKLVTDKEVQTLLKTLVTQNNIDGVLKKCNKAKLEELLMTEYVEIIHYIEELKKKQKESMKEVL